MVLPGGAGNPLPCCSASAAFKAWFARLSEGNPPGAITALCLWHLWLILWLFLKALHETAASFSGQVCQSNSSFSLSCEVLYIHIWLIGKQSGSGHSKQFFFQQKEFHFSVTVNGDSFVCLEGSKLASVFILAVSCLVSGSPPVAVVCSQVLLWGLKIRCSFCLWMMVDRQNNPFCYSTWWWLHQLSQSVQLNLLHEPFWGIFQEYATVWEGKEASFVDLVPCWIKAEELSPEHLARSSYPLNAS